MRGFRLFETRRNTGVIGHIDADEDPANFARSCLARFGVEIEHRDLRTSQAASICALALPRPEAPPVTTAANPLISIWFIS